jgi:hypothetical protein
MRGNNVVSSASPSSVIRLKSAAEMGQYCGLSAPGNFTLIVQESPLEKSVVVTKRN